MIPTAFIFIPSAVMVRPFQSAAGGIGVFHRLDDCRYARTIKLYNRCAGQTLRIGGVPRRARRTADGGQGLGVTGRDLQGADT